MCGVQPKPVDVRPLQHCVSQAADQCKQNELADIKKAVNNCAPQVNQLCDKFTAGALFNGAADRAPQAPQCGCLQPPSSPEALGVPAGKGLETNPAGWPAGSVRTAGGYVVVPEGKDNAWKIFGPQQGPEDKPISRIWGDPHVDEADGQRWDFSKSSSFRLPDGTLIDAHTTSEQGRSLTSSLNIVNGNDRVSINGIDKNHPVTSGVTQDGFDYRSRLIAENPCRDTFVLGGTNRQADGNDRVQWARERHGELQGVVSGTINNADGKNGYDQQIDRNRAFTVDPSLRPDPVRQPAAWGNMIRSEIADAAGATLPPGLRKQVADELGLDDAVSQFKTDAERRLREAGVDVSGAQQQQQQANQVQHHGRHHGHRQNPLDNLFGGLEGLFGGSNALSFGLGAAAGMFSTMNNQLELSAVLGQTLSLNRGLFC